MKGIQGLLLALVGLFCFGCASGKSDGDWIEDVVEAASDRVLWQVTVLALEKTDFPVGSGLEPGKLVAVSGWRISLAPFKDDGYREQCEVRYESKGPRRYAVKVRVKRERNTDYIKPIDITYAKWEKDPDNTERARMVLRIIKSLLGSDVRADQRNAGPATPVVPK